MKTRILVVDEGARAAETTGQALSLLGYSVRTAVFGTPELAVSLDEPCDVLFTEWVRQRPGTAELIASVREREGTTPWIIVATAKPTAANIGAAFSAGADDFIRKPLINEEVVARIAGAERMRRRLGAAPAKEPTVTSRLAALACWRDFHVAAIECLCATTERAWTNVSPIEIASFEPHYAASVTLSFPTRSVEFRVMIEMDQRALETIGAQLYTEVTDGMLLDLVQETANTVGGTFMRAALTEDVELTSSLPSAVAPNDLRTSIEQADERTSVFLRDSAASGRIAAHLMARERRNVFVPASRLREGMVIARDLATSSGALLLKAGTRVTSSASERVASILGLDVTVEVADCAA